MSTQKLDTQIRQVIYGTVPHFITGFLVERSSRGLSKGTIHYYQDELNRFSAYIDLIGVIQFEEITPDIIRRYLLHLGQTRNTGGIHAAYRAIRAFLNWYEEEFEPGDSWRNPIKKVKPNTPNKDPLPGISKTDFQKLIDACKGKFAQRDKAIFLFLLDSGIRVAELCALDMGDVDLITGSVIVQHGKGDKRRVVYVGRNTLKQLRRYLKTGGIVENNAPLFVTRQNQRITFGGLRSRVKALSKKAGIHAPGLHDFRRSYAITMLRNGVDVVTLSRLMGHTSTEVTKRYLHQVNDDLAIAHQKGSPVDNL